MTPQNVGDCRRVMGKLEAQLVGMFRQAREAIMVQGILPQPSAPSGATPEPSESTNWGFHQPAPPDAPQLPPPPTDPIQASRQLDKLIADLRALSQHMTNCGKLTGAIADLLERGRP